MTWFVFVTAYYVLSCCTVPVAGQCTVSSCADSLSESEESLQVSLEEHGYRLETMNQNICSALEKLEAAVNRTKARSQEESSQDLNTLYYNMNLSLTTMTVRNEEHIQAVNESLSSTLQTTQEQEEYLRAMNLSLTSMIVRTEGRIQAVNESVSSTFQIVNRTLVEILQVMHVQLQDQSFALQTVNRSSDEKFQVMQVQLQDQSSTLQTEYRSLDDKIQVMNESVVGALREHDQKLQTMNETISFSIDKINEKLNAILNHVNENLQYLRDQDLCRSTSDVCDCSDIKTNGYTTSGVYRIYVVDEGQRYYANASCDMTTTNGPWTVFQRRKDGSVDFYRGWNDYATGFGNPSGEFWLGNNFLHLLTSNRRYRLRIDLEDFEGGKRYAEYSSLDISSSADKYRLRIGTYSGTAGDSLVYSNDQRFSTKDSDNDAHSSISCAVYQRSGWWHRDCSEANLNGLYLRGGYSSNGSLEGEEGIQWKVWRSTFYSLKTTEMKISSS